MSWRRPSFPRLPSKAQTDYRILTLGAEAPPGIYMMRLVSSGGGKTTAHELAFKAHVDADEIVLARYEAALNAHKRPSYEQDGGEEASRYPRREPPRTLHTDATGRPHQIIEPWQAGPVPRRQRCRGGDGQQDRQK